MPIDRFFYPHSLAVPSILLEDEESRHLNVMRIQPKEEIEVVNGQGELVKARLLSLSKKGAELEILSHAHFPPPQYELILAQALTKPASLEWIIEKGTELGATAFWLFPGDRSEKKNLTPQQEKRLHNLTISALKQCGRLYLPSIVLKPPLREWTKPQGALLFGSLSPEAPLLSGALKKVIFVVGPEKGFSSEETIMLEQTLQAQGVKLHSHTLRAETAAITALAQLFPLLTSN